MPSIKRNPNHDTSVNGLQASEFAHKIHWTKEVRAWEHAKRRLVSSVVKNVVEEHTFDARQSERKFRITQIDERTHSGPSLLALLAVLQAFEKFYDDGRDK